MVKCLVLYNPVSGGSKKFIKKLSYVEKELKKQYSIVDIVATNYAGEASLIAFKACGVYDVLIVSGGDGTFSEVLKGIGENKNSPILGYIPSGSCGDIANNHNIPHNIKKALKVILKGNKKEIDLCKINDSYFSYVAGIGTYTAGVYNADQNLKIKIGKVAYYLEAIKETFQVKSYNLEVSIGKKVYKENDVILALVMNSKSVGGFTYFNYKAKLDDGKVDVFIAGVGTGGTLSGSAKFLKEQNKNIKIVAIEPTKSRVLSSGQSGIHNIQGIGANFVPENFLKEYVDTIESASDEDSILYSRLLAKHQGILVGISSGAALSVAVKMAKQIENEGKIIVVILPDTGERYLSTELFEG